MSGKSECVETAEAQDRRVPDGMVKAGLPELKCPISNSWGLDMSVDFSATAMHSAGAGRF